jgi:hypothetical protein
VRVCEKVFVAYVCIYGWLGDKASKCVNMRENVCVCVREREREREGERERE